MPIRNVSIEVVLNGVKPQLPMENMISTTEMSRERFWFLVLHVVIGGYFDPIVLPYGVMCHE